MSKSLLCHWEGQPQASYFLSLCITFPICKMGLVKPPPSLDSCVSGSINTSGKLRKVPSVSTLSSLGLPDPHCKEPGNILIQRSSLYWPLSHGDKPQPTLCVPPSSLPAPPHSPWSSPPCCCELSHGWPHLQSEPLIISGWSSSFGIKTWDICIVLSKYSSPCWVLTLENNFRGFHLWLLLGIRSLLILKLVSSGEN